MSSTYGNKLKISLFGESHGPSVGVVVDGLPAGEVIDPAQLLDFLARRAPGQGAWATARQEPDAPRFLSGVLAGKTTGSPVCAIIDNLTPRSGDYQQLAQRPRPGHADYTAHLRYGGHADMRGGGHFSGRLTAALCIAGGIALQILARRGVTVGAHIAAIGCVNDRPYETVNLTPDELLAPGRKTFPVLDDQAGAGMQDAIQAVKAARDSIGGVVEGAILGLPVGLGDPIFDGVENRLAQLLFGIPAVKGVEFGAGFAAAQMRGSRHNDAFGVQDGRVVTETNRHGGILGGITTGMPVIFRAAFKPTPSIAATQQTVNLQTGQVEPLEIHGRHDPCIVPRAVPCIEAAAALVALELLL